MDQRQKCAPPTPSPHSTLQNPVMGPLIMENLFCSTFALHVLG